MLPQSCELITEKRFFFSEDSSSNGKCHCMLALSFVVSVCEAKHNYTFVIRITVNNFTVSYVTYSAMQVLIL